MTLSQKLAEYLRSTREEVRKVSWPTRQDTIRYSALVVAITVTVSAFFALLDFGFSQLVNLAAEKRSEAIVNQLNQAQKPVVTPTTSSTTPATTPSDTTQTIDLNGLKDANGQSPISNVQIQAAPSAPTTPSKPASPSTK